MGAIPGTIKLRGPISSPQNEASLELRAMGIVILAKEARKKSVRPGHTALHIVSSPSFIIVFANVGLEKVIKISATELGRLYQFKNHPATYRLGVR
jgi:hypothetical protein